MFNQLKSGVKNKFPGAVQAYLSFRTTISDFHYRHFILPKMKQMDPESVFRWYFKEKQWAGKSGESFSGPGSTLEATRLLQAALPELIQEYDIKSILDIPCGDGNWISQVDLKVEHYLGADIVQELVDLNNRREKKGHNREYHKLNLIKDTLPKVDLIFCRDCLVHLSDDNVIQALCNIKKSGSQYLLTTTFPDDLINRDIITGEWRPINLQCDPFNLPEPVKLILEEQRNDIHRRASLGLWRIDSLPF